MDQRPDRRLEKGGQSAVVLEELFQVNNRIINLYVPKMRLVTLLALCLAATAAVHGETAVSGGGLLAVNGASFCLQKPLE